MFLLTFLFLNTAILKTGNLAKFTLCKGDLLKVEDIFCLLFRPGKKQKKTILEAIWVTVCL